MNDDVEMPKALSNRERIERVESCLIEHGLAMAKVRQMGPNGPQIIGLENNWAQAAFVLTNTKDGDALGVFHNMETSHQIDFHWGWTTDDPKSKGQGLAKLLRWHADVVSVLDQIIASTMVVGTPNTSRLMLSDGKHLIIISERHNNVQKRWLVTAFNAGPKPSKKDRALLNAAKSKISQATSRTVDGASVTGQTNVSISGTNSTDRLDHLNVSDVDHKINNKRE